jgi:hypothetical protein
MPVSETLSDEAREYLALRHEEELIKNRLRVAELKAVLAREDTARKKAEATAAREHVAPQRRDSSGAVSTEPPCGTPVGCPSTQRCWSPVATFRSNAGSPKWL